MKKIVFGFVILAVLAVAFGATGTAYAQGNTPQGQALGANGRGGRAMRSGSVGMGAQEVGSGILHDGYIAYFAEELGIPADELNARLVAGETMAQIALAEGYTLDAFKALMVEARAAAVEQALAAGEITQDQADWILQHGFGVSGASRGAAQGRFANPSCPNLP